jgi:hypothetical protein
MYRFIFISKDAQKNMHFQTTYINLEKCRWGNVAVDSQIPCELLGFIVKKFFFVGPLLTVVGGRNAFENFPSAGRTKKKG